MIKVLQAGVYSTIQDLGRTGFQEYGVPYAGAMDRQAVTIANSLLGNNTNAAVLEMTFTGAKLKFGCDTLICISGANMNPKLNEIQIRNHKVFKVSKEDVLSFGRLERGFRCYLGVLGGFKTELVMHSRSMYPNITTQTTIKKGEVLPIDDSILNYNMPYSNLRIDTSYLDNSILNVFKGPEYEQLNSNQQAQLFSNDFTISKYNNRMAYQLEEPFENDISGMITSPVIPGTAQLTPSGNLIVLMRDCQTTGGYPRVLQLAEASINTLAQKMVQQKITFKLIGKF
jgi:biotin-dependent carboxylase-like uncharacterized protein